MNLSNEEAEELLAGVLAQQLRGVPSLTLANVFTAWYSDSSHGLLDRLVHASAISADDSVLLHRLVDEAVEAHRGDSRAALASFGGLERVNQVYMGSLPFAADANPTIQQWSARPGELDQDRLAVDESPGRYRTVSEYARGGMGRVLLVYDEHFGREVAMKELLPIAPADGETFTPGREAMAVASRFLLEARITGQLEHPSIIPVYELGRHPDGSFYYTMKLVRGRTLSEAVRSAGNLNERLALLPHFLNLCQAVAYAHSRGVIHRDLKPGNVMVGEFGETVVLDWGLAKMLRGDSPESDNLARTLKSLQFSSSADSAHTMEGQVVGTPAYMAPEQAGGQLDEVNERSDVYSLGAILYELLTGDRPYPRGKAAEVLRNVLSEIPKPISTVEPNAPSELIAICERAMSRAPQYRYSDARELATDIDRFQTGALVVAYRYSLVDHFRRWVQRHRAVAWTAATAVIVIAAITVFYTGQLQYTNVLLADSRDEERLQRVLAEEQGYLSSIRLASEYIDSAEVERASETLWATPESLRNWEWGYLLNCAYDTDFKLRGCNIGCYSPNGRILATASRENGVQLWDAETGRIIAGIEGTVTPRIHALAFSPDGEHLATGAADGNIRLWSTETLELIATLGPRDDYILDIAVDAGGNRLLATGGDGNVDLWDLSKMIRLQSFSRPGFALYSAEFSTDGARILASGESETAVWTEDSELPRFVTRGIRARFMPNSHDWAVVRGSEVVVIDGGTGAETEFHVDHSTDVRAVEFSPDATLLAVGDVGGACRLYGTGDTRPLYEFRHGQSLHGLRFSPDSEFLITYSLPGEFRIWHAATGAEIATYMSEPNQSIVLTFRSDAKQFASFGVTDALHAWPLAPPPSEAVVADIPDRIMAVDASASFERIAIGTQSREVHVLNRRSGTGTTAYASFSTEPTYLHALSPDGKLLCLVNDGFTPLVWEVDSEKLATRVPRSSRRITAVRFSPDSEYLALGYLDGYLGAFEARSGVEKAVINVADDSLSALTFIPGTAKVAVGSHTGALSIWDLATATRTYDPLDLKSEITSIAVTPDNAQLLIATADESVRAWNFADASDRLTIRPIRTRWPVPMGDLNRICVTNRPGEPTRVTRDKDGQDLLAIGHGLHSHRHAFYIAEESTLLAASDDGTLRAYRAAPWTAEDLPGLETELWRDRYETYRSRSQTFESTPLPYTGAETLMLAIPTDVLKSGVGLIMDTARKGYQEPGGAKFQVDEQAAQLLQFLGVRAGDRMVSLNEVPLENGIDNTVTDRVRRSITDQHEPQARLRLIRGIRDVEINYRVLEVTDSIQRIVHSRDELQRLLRHCIEMLEENRTAVSQQNAFKNRHLRVFESSDAKYSGFRVANTNKQPERHTLSQLQLQTGDVIVSIDNTRTLTIDDMATELRKAIDRLQVDSQATVEFDLLRGSFTRVRLLMTVAE